MGFSSGQPRALPIPTRPYTLLILIVYHGANCAAAHWALSYKTLRLNPCLRWWMIKSLTTARRLRAVRFGSCSFLKLGSRIDNRCFIKISRLISICRFFFFFSFLIYSNNQAENPSGATRLWFLSEPDGVSTNEIYFKCIICITDNTNCNSHIVAN